MIKGQHIVIAALAATLTAGTCLADRVYPERTEARIIRAGQTTGYHQVREVPFKRRNRLSVINTIVHHEHVDRIVTVDKARSYQPDPYRPLYTRNYGFVVPLDRFSDDRVLYTGVAGRFPQHSTSISELARAKALANDLHRPGARIVWGGPEMAEQSEVSLQPLMILEAPKQATPRRHIPNVPRPPAEQKKPLIASAQ